GMVEDARIAPHVEEAVRLPVAVGELGDDVAGDLRSPAHRLDLEFESAVLLPLRRLDEAVEATEDAVEAAGAKAVLDAVRVHNSVAPIVAGLEPPRLASGCVPQPGGVGQAPIAEFRADDGLVGAAPGIAMRAVRPIGAGGEAVDEAFPGAAMIGDGGVVVEVLKVRFDVEVRRAGRVVDDEPRRIERLQPMIGSAEPGTVLGIMGEVGAPILVDDGPTNDRRMAAVAREDAAHGRLEPRRRALGEA